MAIKQEVIDELLKGYEKPEDLLGDDGLFRQLKKALIERALGAELTHPLGYEKGDGAGRGMANSRNGYSGKTLKTGTGELTIEVPRDRNSSFEPVLVPKGETHFDGFDEKIISMYARGMPVREIQGHLEGVTDAVIEEVREWQNRPLDCVYTRWNSMHWCETDCSSQPCVTTRTQSPTRSICISSAPWRHRHNP